MAEQFYFNEKSGEIELRSPKAATTPKAKRGRKVKVAGGRTLLLPLPEPPHLLEVPAPTPELQQEPSAPRKRRRNVKGTGPDYHERCAQLLGWSVADALHAALFAAPAPSPVPPLYSPGVVGVLHTALARLSPPGAWHWTDPTLPPTAELIFGHRADGSLVHTLEECAGGVAWCIDAALWLGAGGDEALYAASIPPVVDEVTARYPPPPGRHYRDRFIWEEHPSRTQVEVVAVMAGALARAEAGRG